MQVIDRKQSIGYSPSVFNSEIENINIELESETGDVSVYRLKVGANHIHKTISVKWKIDNIGIKGSWTSNGILDKRFRTDWEMPALNSSISNDAPIISLFDNHDNNVVTVATSEIVNLVKIEASLREEDNHFYFHFQFFSEIVLDEDYDLKIIIDKTKENYSHRIQQVADWMISVNGLETMPVPPMAVSPLYSTWYSFHQNLEIAELYEECRIAKELGYGLVIVDDGWQTKDDNRGYDYTGDWSPERFPDMKNFVARIHELGMSIMLWYSVPFCGKKSNVYQKFRGKFLTEDHYWAPVFDPRFPDVRKYLVDTYAAALKDWKLDGFKLDFIDDFKVYPDTELVNLNGRDTLSVTEGVNKLINEIRDSLKEIKPDVLIEFRQQYINPALRKLGNMFRAFDCPNDSLMNRVRTTDVKLLCGESAVHSDMLTWHKNESVEVAALQFTSILFSVPQVSVRLNQRSAVEIKMIQFFTNYWNENKDVLLKGTFSAFRPLSNYPYLCSETKAKSIYGLYDDFVLPVSLDADCIDIINGKMTSAIAIDFKGLPSEWDCEIVDCKGSPVNKSTLTLDNALTQLSCPSNGIIFLRKKP